MTFIVTSKCIGIILFAKFFAQHKNIVKGIQQLQPKCREQCLHGVGVEKKFTNKPKTITIELQSGAIKTLKIYF